MIKRIKELENIVKNKKIKAFGVDIKLTEEQLKKFKKLPEPKYKNPYERVGLEEEYYVVLKSYESDFEVMTYIEYNDDSDNKYYNSGNYYNNKEFAEQVAMEKNLQQRLRKFTYDNGWSEEFWKDFSKAKYFIYRELEENRFICYPKYKTKTRDIYYISEEIAQRAIDEIIIPFIEENPTFKW